MPELCFALSEPLTSLRDYSRLLIHPVANSRLSYFEQYVKFNREHQNNAIKVTLAALIGQIISPCGTGKTRIQICLHVAGMIELTRQGKSGVFVIASHRLGLNRQLCDELADVMIRCGLSFDILTIGSDRPDTKKYYAKYVKEGYTPETSNQDGTLSAKAAEAFIARSRELGRHVLVVSTYNSIDRLQNVGMIDLMTHDEAHNTVREDFTANIHLVKPSVLREYFFTATRKVRGKDDGMNDSNFYGDVLIDILPQKMLEMGEIACPRIHSVCGANDETTNSYDTDMLVKNTTEAFLEHRIHIKADSFSHDEIGAKVIIGSPDIDRMMEIYKHPFFQDFATVHRISCFALSSRGGGEYFVNEKPVTRGEFFTALYALSDVEDALIFNVDMLSEGIDLPAITGVMPMRNLDTIKLIQLIGRALRLTPKDRAGLYSGELRPGDYKKYIKPYGHLILPRHLNSCNEYHRMIEIVCKIYAEYGTPIEELVIQDKYASTDPNDLRSMTRRDTGGSKDYQLQHTVADVVASVYTSLFEGMTSHDRMGHLTDGEVQPVVPQNIKDMVSRILMKQGASP